MKILLINVHSFHNAGDAVLNKIAIHLLQKSFPNAQITVSLNDPENFEEPDIKATESFLYWSKNDQGRWRWFAFWFLLVTSWITALKSHFFKQPVSARSWLPWHFLFQAYVSADLVVSCPGNFLYSSGKLGLTLFINLYSIIFALFLGKPIYMMPQTIGPLNYLWERKLVRWVLSKMRIVMVRDVISKQLLKQIGLQHPRCHLLPDIAFVYPRQPPSLGEKLLEEYGADIKSARPLLGVTLINWGAQNQRFATQATYEHAVAQTIRSFIDYHRGTAVLFAQVQGPTINDDDRIPARHVANQLADLGNQVIFIERKVTQDELKSAYSLMDFFLGSRLHSNIFALSELVPVVAIQYQYKTAGVMRMLNLDEWVIDIESVTPPKLADLLENAWNCREKTRLKIQSRLPQIIEQVESVGQRIADDFYKNHS